MFKGRTTTNPGQFGRGLYSIAGAIYSFVKYDLRAGSCRPRSTGFWQALPGASTDTT
jgi:hypothetical protein